MRRFASALLVVAALLATSCAADDDNQAVSTDTTVATGDTDSPTGDTVKFGTLDSPCGEAPDGKVATVKAEDAVLAAQDAVTKLQDFSSLAAKAPALLATMESVRDNAELLGTRLLEGDITNALSQSTLLGDSLLGVGDAVRPINTSLILREAI